MNRYATIAGALLTGLLLLPSATAGELAPEPPSPQSVLGYPLGARITDYHGMERYFSILAEASPRVVYGSYGSDYEGRQLRYVVISSVANLERLDAVKSASARLADPRELTAGEEATLLAETPAILWLNYSTDGNETAGLESAMLMAHHLAADGGRLLAELLERAVIVITPVMNPSSHERWATWSNSFAAWPLGNPDPLAMEHHPPWGVLTNNNHYLVDLNRESVWAIQRESAALRAFYYEWNPVVFVDHHGEYDEFTGPGYEEPLNPLYTAGQRGWLERFGRSIGRRFADRGWTYSRWEAGSFYPGFWESFGTLNGAIGFTYETTGGGRRGLRHRRGDGSLATLETASRQHFEASLAVIEEAVGKRRELLADFVDFRRSALHLARQVEERVFLVEPGSDPARSGLLLEILMANGVEVYQASSSITARRVHDYFGQTWHEKKLAPGTFVIPAEQPQARLLLTLMRKDLKLPQETLETAETHRRNQETAGSYNPTTYPFYDVTAWSLPLTLGVPAYWAEEPIDAGLTPLATVAPEARPATTVVSAPAPPALREARYGYAFSGDGILAPAMIADLLRRGLVLNVASAGFTVDGGSFPRGSVLIKKERNPGIDLRELLSEVAARWRIGVCPVDSTYGESGPSMGSNRFVYLREPKVAVLVGEPVSIRSFGDLWFLLERQVQMAFTAVYKEQLDEKALSRYDLLVLPDGPYDESSFSREWVDALRGWISRGGTLVCLKRASRWAADPDRNLTAARMRPAKWAAQGDGASRATRGVPGAILLSQVDSRHYLTQGYEDRLAVLIYSNLAFEPDSGPAAPVTLAARDRIHLAGFAYADSLDRLAETPYLLEERLGSGHVVLFLDDPNFRNYWLGLSRLFLNSILLSPSF